MRFPFIHAQKAFYPLTVLCRVLRVRRSGYYAWRNRLPSQRAQTDRLLSARIGQAFRQSRGTYGSPRIRAELREQGLRTSRRRVERLMRAQGLCALRKRRRVRTTDSRHRLPIAPNRLLRDFTAPAPNRVWTTDVTFIWTHSGWLYLAVLLDLFSRRVVGYAMSSRNDEYLVLSALRRARATRRPPRGLVHHSDRGSVYCGKRYQALLASHGLVPSMSRQGDCWDNAVTESFFGTLKQEHLYRLGVQSEAATRSTVFWYLEAHYNRHRRHSKLCYASPMQYEEDYHQRRSAALPNT